MGLFQSNNMMQASEYVPLWENPAASAPEPEPAPTEPEEAKDESLNRLQRSLIWFAAILIAVSIFQNFQNNF